MTVSVFLLAATLAAKGNSRFPAAPGQWEFTTTFAMGGLPVAPPPRIVERCVDGAPDPPALLAEIGAPADDCRIDGWTAEGRTVRWSGDCAGRYRGSGAGRLAFDGDRGEGEFTIQVEDGRGAKHPVRYRIQARRDGACPP